METEFITRIRVLADITVPKTQETLQAETTAIITLGISDPIGFFDVGLGMCTDPAVPLVERLLCLETLRKYGVTGVPIDGQLMSPWNMLSPNDRSRYRVRALELVFNPPADVSTRSSTQNSYMTLAVKMHDSKEGRDALVQSIHAAGAVAPPALRMWVQLLNDVGVTDTLRLGRRVHAPIIALMDQAAACVDIDIQVKYLDLLTEIAYKPRYCTAFGITAERILACLTHIRDMYVAHDENTRSIFLCDALASLEYIFTGNPALFEDHAVTGMVVALTIVNETMASDEQVCVAALTAASTMLSNDATYDILVPGINDLSQHIVTLTQTLLATACTITMDVDDFDDDGVALLDSSLFAALMPLVEHLLQFLSVESDQMLGATVNTLWSTCKTLIAENTFDQGHFHALYLLKLIVMYDHKQVCVLWPEIESQITYVSQASSVPQVHLAIAEVLKTLARHTTRAMEMYTPMSQFMEQTLGAYLAHDTTTPPGHQHVRRKILSAALAYMTAVQREDMEVFTRDLLEAACSIIRLEKATYTFVFNKALDVVTYATDHPHLMKRESIRTALQNVLPSIMATLTTVLGNQLEQVQAVVRNQFSDDEDDITPELVYELCGNLLACATSVMDGLRAPEQFRQIATFIASTTLPIDHGLQPALLHTLTSALAAFNTPTDMEAAGVVHALEAITPTLQEIVQYTPPATLVDSANQDSDSDDEMERVTFECDNEKMVLGVHTGMHDTQRHALQLIEYTCEYAPNLSRRLFTPFIESLLENRDYPYDEDIQELYHKVMIQMMGNDLPQLYEPVAGAIASTLVNDEDGMYNGKHHLDYLGYIVDIAKTLPDLEAVIEHTVRRIHTLHRKKSNSSAMAKSTHLLCSIAYADPMGPGRELVVRHVNAGLRSAIRPRKRTPFELMDLWGCVADASDVQATTEAIMRDPPSVKILQSAIETIGQRRVHANKALVRELAAHWWASTDPESTYVYDTCITALGRLAVDGIGTPYAFTDAELDEWFIHHPSTHERASMSEALDIMAQLASRGVPVPAACIEAYRPYQHRFFHQDKIHFAMACGHPPPPTL